MTQQHSKDAGHRSTSSSRFAPWPVFDDDEIEAAVAVLKSGKVNYWTGDEVRLFEEEFARYTGSAHAIAVANGTVALELALRALDVGAGDEVIVPSRTFVATASAVVMRGAVPVVADVDLDTQNLTAATVAPLLTQRTKAIIAVHLAGWPCDMDSLGALAKQHDLYLIEDCAQAHGATYKGRPIGSFGDVAAFSFCQDKIMTTAGEGGMVMMNDDEWWQRAWAFKDHGKNYQTIKNPLSPGYRWVHDEFGTNWRLTAMQASIGRRQLAKLDDWVEIRRRNAQQLNTVFAAIAGLRVPAIPADIRHAYYKYYAFVRPERLRPDWDRDRILKAINAAGVPCGTGVSSEIYRERAFVDAGLGPAQRHPNAVNLGENSLMFVVHPTLGKLEMERTGEVVSAVMSEASR